MQKIIIPEEYKENYWSCKLFVSRKNKDSFFIFTHEEKERLDNRLSELYKNSDNIAFNRFIMASFVEVESVDGSLELPNTLLDFSNGKNSFSFQNKCLMVSKIESIPPVNE